MSLICSEKRKVEAFKFIDIKFYSHVERENIKPLLMVKKKLIYVYIEPGTLTGIRGNEGIDGELLVTGLASLLRQFHQDHTLRFIELLSQYITSFTTHTAARFVKYELLIEVFAL